ncbi:hypothetical protein ASE60_21015 [Ensifer sp. Root278]|nr:hypothetical protein ASE60_21015 [Ensifer sp. Root278]
MAIEWEKGRHAKVRRGRVGNEIVAEVHTLGTHKHTKINNDVYSVTVLARELSKRFRGVDEAKAAAEVEYNNLINRS